MSPVSGGDILDRIRLTLLRLKRLGGDAVCRVFGHAWDLDDASVTCAETMGWQAVLIQAPAASVSLGHSRLAQVGCYGGLVNGSDGLSARDASGLWFLDFIGSVLFLLLTSQGLGK